MHKFHSAQLFIAVMLRKGYDGRFVLTSNTPAMVGCGLIEDCLNTFLDSVKKNENHKASMVLMSDFSNECRSPPWCVKFVVDYQFGGFRINRLCVYQIGQSFPIRLDINTLEAIPRYNALPHLLSSPTNWRSRIFAAVLGVWKQK